MRYIHCQLEVSNLRSSEPLLAVFLLIVEMEVSPFLRLAYKDWLDQRQLPSELAGAIVSTILACLWSEGGGLTHVTMYPAFTSKWSSQQVKKAVQSWSTSADIFMNTDQIYFYIQSCWTLNLKILLLARLCEISTHLRYQSPYTRSLGKYFILFMLDSPHNCLNRLQMTYVATLEKPWPVLRISGLADGQVNSDLIHSLTSVNLWLTSSRCVHQISLYGLIMN